MSVYLIDGETPSTFALSDFFSASVFAAIFVLPVIFTDGICTSSVSVCEGPSFLRSCYRGICASTFDSSCLSGGETSMLNFYNWALTAAVANISGLRALTLASHLFLIRFV